MPRTFNGTSDVITCAIGANNFAFGPGTIAAIIRRNTPAVSGTYNAIVSIGTGTTVELLFTPSDSGNPDAISMAVSGTVSESATKILAADGWCVVAITKATGSVVPRFHKVPISTTAATHANGSLALANSAVPATSIYLGSSIATAGDFSKGDLVVAGVWNVVLTDTQIENLAVDLTAWFQIQPLGLWLLDQGAVAQKVNDLTGGGANESARSGTSITTTTMPGWNYGFD